MGAVNVRKTLLICAVALAAATVALAVYLHDGGTVLVAYVIMLAAGLVAMIVLTAAGVPNVGRTVLFGVAVTLRQSQWCSSSCPRRSTAAGSYSPWTRSC